MPATENPSDRTENLPQVPAYLYWGEPELIFVFLGSIAAVVLGALRGVTWDVILVTILLALLTGLGITVGFHRLLTHHSFKTYRPIIWTLAILGCMAGQSSLFFWITEHRKHHRHSDGADDPHSPLQEGFWHAHIGWLFGRQYTYDPKELPDLMKQRDIVWIDRFSFYWYLIGLLVPGLICGLISGTLYGALMGFLWGGLLRHFLTLHGTFLVNSIGHSWGSQDYITEDESRNNLIVGLLSLGEGWHNNHHAFPYSARHGLNWWQIDVSWYVIWSLEKLGLAWDVRRPKLRQNTNRNIPTAVQSSPRTAESRQNPGKDALPGVSRG